MKYLIHDNVKMIAETESDVEPMSIYQVLACDDPQAKAREMELLQVDGTPFDPLPVPEEVTPRQLRLALLRVGVTPDTVTGMINQMPEPQRSGALVEWEFTSVFKRNHPLITVMAQAMGKSEGDVDQIFRLAVSL